MELHELQAWMDQIKEKIEQPKADYRQVSMNTKYFMLVAIHTWIETEVCHANGNALPAPQDLFESVSGTEPEHAPKGTQHTIVLR